MATMMAGSPKMRVMTVIFYIRWYRLESGRDSSYGEIWLYDPDFIRVQGWVVGALECIEHGYADGLRADPYGLLHGVILRVPVSLMEKGGTYRFVLHFYDDYADSYKNHQVKAALEVNQQTYPQAAWIWIDGLNGQDLQSKVNWTYVGQSLRVVCTYVFTWQYAGLTSGSQDAVNLGDWTGVRFRRLSGSQVNWQRTQASHWRVDVRRTVIFTVTSHGFAGVQIEDIARINAGVQKPRHQFPPDRPAVAAISIHGIDGENAVQDTWLRSNVVLHELTHLLNDRSNHCRNNVDTCVWRGRKNDYFYGQMLNRITIGGAPYYLPWHNLDEINEMRRSLGLRPHNP